MDEVIGILELLGWIVGVIALAAAFTFVMVKLFPGKDEAASSSAPPGEQAS